MSDVPKPKHQQAPAVSLTRWRRRSRHARRGSRGADVSSALREIAHSTGDVYGGGIIRPPGSEDDDER